MNRREFIGGVSALAALGVEAAEEKPLLRIGAISDDHLHPNKPETHRRTKACFDLFRREGVDIVVDTGDIADLSHVSELEWFRRTFDETFAGTSTVPFFCIANHDYNYVPNTRKNDPKNVENAWRALKMESANPKAVVKGYRFVNVFQNENDPMLFEKTVAEAVAANEGNRPVFVVNHVPPYLTTTGTVHWSSQPIRRVLNKYPQVVALTGHIHTAIKWAANIWQGEFTAINLGAHAEYSNKIAGEATVLDVFADRIDVRRYEAVTGREIGADDRWSIPLPLDPAHGPYRTALRTKSCPVATISKDAKLEFVQNAKGTSGQLVFASARPGDVTKSYRITIESQGADGKWNFLAMLNWSAPQVMDEPAVWKCPLSPAILDGGRLHRATIVPANSHEVVGKPQTFEFAVPPNPMAELPASALEVARFQRGCEPGRNVFTPGKDGWFSTGRGESLIVLSKAFSAAIHGKSTVTLVFDLASEQPGDPNTLSIFKFPSAGGNAEKGIGSRIYTLPGTHASHRYSWTIKRGKKPDPGDEYALAIREGGKSRFKVNAVRCFVA